MKTSNILSLFLLVIFYFYIGHINAQYIFKFDGHVHCNATPDAIITVQAAINCRKNVGFTAMTITNHEPQVGLTSFNAASRAFLSWEKMSVDPTFPIIPGMEYTARTQNILIYWNPAKYSCIREQILTNEVYKKIFWNAGWCKTEAELIRLAEVVHNLDGIIGVTHYTSTVDGNLIYHPECPTMPLDVYYKQGKYDFIEVINHMTPDYIAYQYAVKCNIPMVSGTDWHTCPSHYRPIAHTLINATENTSQGIWNQLKAGKMKVIYDWSSYPSVSPGSTVSTVSTASPVSTALNTITSQENTDNAVLCSGLIAPNTSDASIINVIEYSFICVLCLIAYTLSIF